MKVQRLKILILGTTGMLGHTLLKKLSERDNLDVYATCRSRNGLSQWFQQEIVDRIYSPVDANKFNSVRRILVEIKPDVVINCIGVIKQLAEAKDPLQCIEINALFPHRLAQACKSVGARLIHISTDCVFSGKKGMYLESDLPDCDDLYGRTKLLGEVDYPHTVTLRTSIIGHELHGGVSLIDWFLGQKERARGFTKAIYSGFPTVEMARIIAEIVIPHHELSGLHHVSSEPISKFDLLCLVRDIYGKTIEIEPFDDFVCDRSLDSSRFRAATGYVPPPWPELVAHMYEEKAAESVKIFNNSKEGSCV